MSKVTSKDGTAIAFDRSGNGPAVILVGGASQSRMGAAHLAELLSKDFTVFNYDRRGRGESGDTQPYAIEREIEDIEALIATARRAAALYGTSSGAVLALKAAATGLDVTKLALWEPNVLVDNSRPVLPADYVAHLNALIAAGRRGDACEYFLTAGAGIPAEFVAPLRMMPEWSAMEAVAHTLAYDGMIVADTLNGQPVTATRWASVTMPTIVMDGGTIPWLTTGAAALASALPQATRRTLPGQPHNVDAEAIAPVITEFFKD